MENERLTDDTLYINSVHFGVMCNFTPYCGEERAKEVNDFLKKVFGKLKAYETIGTVEEFAKLKANDRLVEVVRCGECQHSHKTKISIWYDCWVKDIAVKENEFCSYGTRKEPTQ